MAVEFFVSGVVISLVIGAIVAVLYQFVNFFRHKPKTKTEIVLWGAIGAWICACLMIPTVNNTLSSRAATAVAEKESIEAQYGKLQETTQTEQSDKERLRQSLDALQKDYDSLQAEYNDYKERMEPYEAEADAHQEELDAEAMLGYETGITYDNIARNPDEYEGRKVKFQGRVVQMLEDRDAGLVNIRLAVDDNYGQIIYVSYMPAKGESRILEDDEITVYGTSMGMMTYTATLGNEVTVPWVNADRYEMN